MSSVARTMTFPQQKICQSTELADKSPVNQRNVFSMALKWQMNFLCIWVRCVLVESGRESLLSSIRPLFVVFVTDGHMGNVELTTIGRIDQPISG
ncbi:MAG: hypothetical protein P8045_02985 [Candidatus Thiodiazotropha sp.]|jgi:hypothetical protein